MDRDNRVDLLDNHRINMVAFQEVRSAVDQPIGNHVDARDVLHPPKMGLIDVGQHCFGSTGQCNRALEITTPPMLDGGVDLPHRCVPGTGFDAMRVADCLFLALDASALLWRTQLAIHQSEKPRPI